MYSRIQVGGRDRSVQTCTPVLSYFGSGEVWADLPKYIHEHYDPPEVSLKVGGEVYSVSRWVVGADLCKLEQICLPGCEVWNVTT